MFDELRGGTCILGCHFHLVGSPEGGIKVYFRFRECLVVVVELRGSICILGCHFSRAEGDWMEQQVSVGDIFQVFRAPSHCRA